MIGIGRRAPAVAGALLLAPLLGPGGQDPATAERADAIVRERRHDALAALDSVAAALEGSLASGRLATDAVLNGSGGAGEHLEAAADAVEEARDDARAAEDAIHALEAARRLRGGNPAPLPGAVSDAELREIAEELRLAGPAADGAALLRRRADEVLSQLDRALAGAVDGEHTEARQAVDRARAAHGAMSASATASDVLPVWLDATDAMITAVTSLIDATGAGEREAADAAAADFAAVAEDAATADRALRIAVAEVAGEATSAPLARIGAAIAAVEAARAEVAREAIAP